MLVLGHTGITLGAAVVMASALPNSSQTVTTANRTPGDNASWLTSLGSRIDIRLLMIGSLLPDIFDKPIGLFLFGETFSNGRIFCHTLLFLILITLAGVHLYRHYSKIWLLVLAFGTFTHLICDQMWRTPQTLFWPLYGFTFERIDSANWLWNMLHDLKTDPTVYVPELVGAAILIWFALILLRRKRLCAFIRYGQVQ